MFDAGGNEVCSSEYLEILFGMPTAFGSVDDLFGLFIPMDFFQGEWSAKHVFGKLTTCVTIKWQCGGVTRIQGEPTGFPGKELIGFFAGQELFIDEGSLFALALEMKRFRKISLSEATLSFSSKGWKRFCASIRPLAARM